MSVDTMIRKSGHRLTVERPQWSQDETGARQVDGHWTVIRDVLCWRQPVSARLRELFAARGVTVTHRIYVGRELELEEGDKLVVTLRDGSETAHRCRGQTEQSGLGHLWSIDAEEER